MVGQRDCAIRTRRAGAAERGSGNRRMRRNAVQVALQQLRQLSWGWEALDMHQPEPRAIRFGKRQARICAANIADDDHHCGGLLFMGWTGGVTNGMTESNTAGRRRASALGLPDLQELL